MLSSHQSKILLIFENVFYLEKNVLSCVIFDMKFVSLNTVSYSSLFVLHDLADKIWDVGCWGRGMLGI